MPYLDLGGDETTSRTAPELLAAEDQRQWIVHDIMTSGGLYTIGGNGEAGVKTELALDIAVAIVTGTTVLDRLPCTASPVAYLNFAKSAAALSDLLAARGEGHDLRQLTVSSPDSTSILAPYQVSRDNLADGGVLVLDGLSDDRVRPPKPGVSAWLQEVGASLPRITTLAVLPPGISASKAAQNLNAAGHFELRRTKGVLRLTVTGRELNDSRFDYFGGWGRAESAALLSEEQRDIIEYLRQAKDKVNDPKTIAREIGVTINWQFRKWVQRLAKDGSIVHDGHGKYSHPDWTGAETPAAETEDDPTEAHEEASVASLAQDVQDLEEARADEMEDATT